METLTKDFEVPSKGIFGGPEKVTLRPMTTKEEKLLYTANDSTFIEKIVKSCCIDPKDLDTNKLHPADLTYLLFMLREMTFGPTYRQQMQCPYCNLKQDIEIDITEMKVYLLDEDELNENVSFELPICGDAIELKLLSNGDISNIAKEVKRLNRQDKLQDAESYEYIYRFASCIKTINNEERPIKDIMDYLDNLNLRDFDEIKKRLSKIHIGLDTSLIRNCKKCGEEVEVLGTTVPEFFRSY